MFKAKEGKERDDRLIFEPHAIVVSIDILLWLRNTAAASEYYGCVNVHIQT